MEPDLMYGPPPTPSFFEQFKNHLIDFIQTLVVFGAIFALIFWQVAQPHKVSGSSMYPTLENGDYILTDKLSYKLNPPQRDDIIVFKNPRNESEDFVKRIMALPGDSIKVESDNVFLNGQKLDETYLPPNTPTEPHPFLQEGETVKAGPDQYFVLGDNRQHSSDSREWGAVAKEGIIGKVIFRYWPPQNFGLVHSLP